MATWLTGSPANMNMGDPAHPWPESPTLPAGSTLTPKRPRSITHTSAPSSPDQFADRQPYVDDPAIMSWKLANEPRPGGSDAGVARNRDATLLTDERRADPLARNHLVSLGHEGT